MPNHVKNVVLYRDLTAVQPLQIEQQLNAMFSPAVT